MAQNSLEKVEFVENPEPRCAVALVFDEWPTHRRT